MDVPAVANLMLLIWQESEVVCIVPVAPAGIQNNLEPQECFFFVGECEGWGTLHAHYPPPRSQAFQRSFRECVSIAIMTDLSTLILGSAIAVTIALILTGLFSTGNGNPPLPPGPKGLPVAGNLNDLPKPGVLEAQHWLKHKDIYGMSNVNSSIREGSLQRLTHTYRPN